MARFQFTVERGLVAAGADGPVLDAEARFAVKGRLPSGLVSDALVPGLIPSSPSKGAPPSGVEMDLVPCNEADITSVTVLTLLRDGRSDHASAAGFHKSLRAAWSHKPKALYKLGVDSKNGRACHPDMEDGETVPLFDGVVVDLALDETDLEVDSANSPEASIGRERSGSAAPLPLRRDELSALGPMASLTAAAAAVQDTFISTKLRSLGRVAGMHADLADVDTTAPVSFAVAASAPATQAPALRATAARPPRARAQIAAFEVPFNLCRADAVPGATTLRRMLAPTALYRTGAGRAANLRRRELSTRRGRSLTDLSRAQTDARRRLATLALGDGNTLTAGATQVHELPRAGTSGSTLLISGDQLVRVIALDRAGVPRHVSEVLPGDQRLDLPAVTHRVVLMGLGRHSRRGSDGALLRSWVVAGVAGVDADTKLVWLGQETWLAPDAVPIAPLTGRRRLYEVARAESVLKDRVTAWLPPLAGGFGVSATAEAGPLAADSLAISVGRTPASPLSLLNQEGRSAVIVGAAGSAWTRFDVVARPGVEVRGFGLQIGPFRVLHARLWRERNWRFSGRSFLSADGRSSVRVGVSS